MYLYPAFSSLMTEVLICIETSPFICQVCQVVMPRLGHWKGDSLNHPMLIIARYLIRQKGHREPVNEVGIWHMLDWILITTAQKMEFSIEGFFHKCDQIRRKQQIWSHLLKKSLTENFIFCTVYASEYLIPWLVSMQIHATFPSYSDIYFSSRTKFSNFWSNQIVWEGYVFIT